MLPNLIVIGAPRAGTTSLHRYLSLHPQIFMSARKELDFFAAEKNWGRGLSWYESQFNRPADVMGESSPSYSCHPVHSGVPERMASLVPEAKVIYLVRDPVERMLSSYRFSRLSAADPEESLADLDRGRHVVTSRYATQLERYLEHYPLERILVVDSADLFSRRIETLRRIFRFLAVEEGFESPDFGIEHNVLHRQRLTKRGRTAAKLLSRVIGEYRTHRLRARLPRAVQRPFTQRVSVPAAKLDESLRADLTVCFKQEADRLRALTGQTFPTWSV